MVKNSCKEHLGTMVHIHRLEIINIPVPGATLRVNWTDGFEHEFHALWLRENSQEPEFRDPATGMRIQQASALSVDLSISTAHLSADEHLVLTFSDSHSCTFKAAYLYQAARQPRPV